MATKQKIATIRMHRARWLKWTRAARKRGMTFTKLVELAMDKELNGAPASQAVAPERSRSGA